MISPALVAQLALFQASVQAANPVRQASALTKSALVKAGQQLIAAIDHALVKAGTPLDSSDPAGFGSNLVVALEGLSTATGDQAVLADWRGMIGRAVFNLAQA